MRYGKTQIATLNPTVQISGAYTSGRPVGTLQQITLGNPWSEGVLKSLLVADADNQAAALTVLFFSDLPAATIADNTALTLSAADMKKIVAKVEVAAADYKAVGGVSVAQVAVSLALRGTQDTTRTVYVLVVAGGTPTYTGAGNLQLRAGILLD